MPLAQEQLESVNKTEHAEPWVECATEHIIEGEGMGFRPVCLSGPTCKAHCSPRRSQTFVFVSDIFVPPGRITETPQMSLSP